MASKDDCKRRGDGGIVEVRPVRANYIRGNVAGWAWGVMVDMQPRDGGQWMSAEDIAEAACATQSAVSLATEVFNRLHPNCDGIDVITPNDRDGIAVLVPSMDCKCKTGNYN